jgi:hypothetical protein
MPNKSSLLFLFSFYLHTAILAKVVGKSGASGRRSGGNGNNDENRFNIVITHVYKNTEGRNAIASKSKKIQLVVPAAASSCRCPNLEVNK